MEAVNVFAERMKGITDSAAKALKKAAEDMKRYADMHRRDAPEYKVGDKVYLEGKYLATTRPSLKLDDKRYGPFRVEEVIGPVNCRLKIPPQWKIHPVFHASLLRPCHEDITIHPDEYERPPPELVAEEEEWEVEKLLDCRRAGRGFSYLVLYKGYPREEAQWRPAKEVAQLSPILVKNFHRDHPTKPRPQSIISLVHVHFD